MCNIFFFPCLQVGRFFHIAFKSAGCVVAAAMVVVSGGSWFVRKCVICCLPHQRASVCLCACSASNSQLFPASLRCLTEVCVPRSFASSLRLFIGIFSHRVPTLGAMRHSWWAFAGANPSRALGMGWERSGKWAEVWPGD